MREVDLRQIEDSVVLHFGGELNRIDAYTFARAITGIADAIGALNALADPGQDIQLSIDAIAPGSFRVRLKGAKRPLNNLFSLQGIGTALIMQAFVLVLQAQCTQLAPAEKPHRITVDADDVVVIHSDDETIIVPAKAYAAYECASDSKSVRRGLSDAFDAMSRDPAITEFGLASSLQKPEFVVSFPRSVFKSMSQGDDAVVGPRQYERRASLVIIRVVFEEKRFWEFLWHGQRIPARISDKQFYEELARRKYKIGSGDALDVVLRVTQEPIGETGLFADVGYEVLKVHRVLEKATQLQLGVPARRAHKRRASRKNSPRARPKK